MLYSNQHFLPSQPCFPPVYNWKTLFKSHFCWLLSTTIFILNDNRLNLSQTIANKPWFLRVCSTSLLKTLWEEENLLVTSNFSFSRSVFHLFEEPSAIFNKNEIVVCKLSIWTSLKFVVWKELTHYQMTNFRLFQTERLFRRQFRIWRKWQKVIQTGRKHCGKRRNCSFQAISPFPTVFSKGLFPRGIKRCHCVGMG